ncbi:hypothetical protein J4219_00175 [Candidatus Woesearchaeota archaeon]|nr:hypothetical protein [Candidatus Woesearchaeota archaeon]
MKRICVLSIQTGHNATAGLLIDGKIVGVVSEERFTRVKNSSEFPVTAIRWLLDFAKIGVSDLGAVAVCGEKILAPPIIQGGHARQSLLAKAYGNIEYALGSYYRPLFAVKDFIIDRPSRAKGRQALLDLLKRTLHVTADKVRFVDHHTCHAYSAYYGQNDKRSKSLILTLDGEGDDSCSTVNVAQDFKIDKLASTWRHYSVGYAYSMTTKFLGMTPLEHEYKVMGLAPYAATKEQKYFMKTHDRVFKDVLWLDEKNPLTFKSAFPMNRFDKWLAQKAVGERFDNVAGALQHMTEALVSKWVVNAIKKTKQSNVYAGGGVFMNVKMNMALADLPEVENLHVFPSCGDESNPIGAAYYTYLGLCGEQGRKANLQRVTDLYLGPSFDEDAESYIKKNNLSKKYDVKESDARMVAELLAKGEIVARCAGRMEFGARSLGNRAILANPSDLRYVWQINEQIKMRDFWMPFAPSILKERADDYIVNPKKLDAPYMIMAFKSTDLARKELRAAMHQADYTVRPQLVERSWNEKYYDIIKEFEGLTGIGGVLNTSFNLHGKPVVCSPRDAVKETFDQSGLRHLLLGNYLISKK